MSEETPKLITLTVEGTDSEGGHVRADELISKLEHLLDALNGIDRLVGDTGRAAIYYRVVAAGHQSPFHITLEPVIKPKEKAKVKRDHISKCYSRFYGEIKAIREMKPVSPEIDNSLLEDLRDLAEGAGEEFKRASISIDSRAVQIDETFEKNVRRMLDEEDFSFGSIAGKLEAVNIHGSTKRCWIYPSAGPQRICCDFLPGNSEAVREALGAMVRVTGYKYFRPPNPFPFRIKVRDFELLAEADSVPLTKLGGIAPEATGQLSSVDFVRKIRDEWD